MKCERKGCDNEAYISVCFSGIGPRTMKHFDHETIMVCQKCEKEADDHPDPECVIHSRTLVSELQKTKYYTLRVVEDNPTIELILWYGPEQLEDVWSVTSLSELMKIVKDEPAPIVIE